MTRTHALIRIVVGRYIAGDLPLDVAGRRLADLLRPFFVPHSRTGLKRAPRTVKLAPFSLGQTRDPVTFYRSLGNGALLPLVGYAPIDQAKVLALYAEALRLVRDLRGDAA